MAGSHLFSFPSSDPVKKHWLGSEAPNPSDSFDPWIRCIGWIQWIGSMDPMHLMHLHGSDASDRIWSNSNEIHGKSKIQ